MLEYLQLPFLEKLVQKPQEQVEMQLQHIHHQV